MRRTAFRRLLTSNPWRHNGTWVLSGTVWTNTPALGADTISNGEFAADTSGWGAINTATLTRRDFSSSPNIAPTGGSDNFGLEVASGGNANSSAQASPTLANGVWYFSSVRMYSPSADTGVNVAKIVGAQPSFAAIGPTAEDQWQTVVSSGRATGTGGDFRLRCSSSTGGDVAYFDAVSLKPFTFNQLIVLRKGGPASTVTGKPTMSSGTQAGVCAKINALQSPTDGIFVYHDGTNIKMDKLVAGTWTNLISTAVTYSAGATIEIRSNGTNVWQAWYNGSQRGTDQTISDASIVNNNLYGGFSTYSGNTIDSLAVS